MANHFENNKQQVYLRQLEWDVLVYVVGQCLREDFCGRKWSQHRYIAFIASGKNYGFPQVEQIGEPMVMQCLAKKELAGSANFIKIIFSPYSSFPVDLSDFLPGTGFAYQKSLQTNTSASGPSLMWLFIPISTPLPTLYRALKNIWSSTKTIQAPAGGLSKNTC